MRPADLSQIRISLMMSIAICIAFIFSGNVLAADTDGDGIDDATDNCVYVFIPAQTQELNSRNRMGMDSYGRVTCHTVSGNISNSAIESSTHLGM